MEKIVMHVSDLLSASDIAILCSHQEGFWNVILEGMSAGLPLIVTDVEGNREAVVAGETGLIVPPHDPLGLGAAIIHLAQHPEVRQRFGIAGRKLVESKFTLQACVAQYDALYRGLLNRKVPNEFSEMDSMAG
jgi:glycosyltransferase involved in cell wall biosynthesis